LNGYDSRNFQPPPGRLPALHLAPNVAGESAVEIVQARGAVRGCRN
jgi:hypothetical protein